MKNTDQSEDKYITKAQLAERMEVTIRTIETWMQDGKLPFEKIGRTVRFHWGDVRAHISRLSRPTPCAHTDLRPLEGCKARLQQFAKEIRQRSKAKIDHVASVHAPPGESPV